MSQLTLPGFNNVVTLIQYAYRLAGVLRRDDTLSPEQVNMGLFLFNATLAEWGANAIYVFILTSTEFIGISGKQDYVIAANSNADIQTEPYVNITHANFNNGQITYTMGYKTRKEFDAITLKNISSFSGWYSYTKLEDSTIFRVWPRSVGGEIYKITGKKRLGYLNLYEELQGIPDYSLLALLYFVADEIVSFENSQKPEGFDDKKKIHYENMVMSNDLDTEKELIQSPRVYAPMAPSRFTRQTRNGYY